MFRPMQKSPVLRRQPSSRRRRLTRGGGFYHAFSSHSPPTLLSIGARQQQNSRTVVNEDQQPTHKQASSERDERLKALLRLCLCHIMHTDHLLTRHSQRNGTQVDVSIVRHNERAAYNQCLRRGSNRSWFGLASTWAAS